MPPGISGEESGAIFKFVQSIFPFVTHLMIRKLGHFSEYLLLSILLRNSFKPAQAFFISWIVAFFDETIQIFSGRGPAILDVWIDVAGALTGIIIFFVILWINGIRQERGS